MFLKIEKNNVLKIEKKMFFEIEKKNVLKIKIFIYNEKTIF